jgi:hypothetical protein
MSSNLVLSVFAKETYLEGKDASYSRKRDLGVACLYCVEQLVVVYLQLCGVRREGKGRGERGGKEGGEGGGAGRGGRNFPQCQK